MLGKDIVDLVIVKMEEYTPYGPSSGATLLNGGDHLDEVKPVYSYIHQHLKEAANEILRAIPLTRAAYKSATVTANVDSSDSRIGSIVLPDDFLRLHTFKMKGWTRPVHVVITENDPAYTLQFNRWTRGTCQKPIATYINAAAGANGGKLYYYSVPEGDAHTVDMLYYIPVFSQTQDYDSSISELIALNCARKVYEVYGNTEQVKMLTDEINSVLENLRQ